MRRVVLDSSAVLARIFDEPGAAAVQNFLEQGAILSTVNLAEVVSILRQSDWPIGTIESLVAQFDVKVIPFGRTTALATGDLWPNTRALGLSLGDRSCLALARELGLPAVTGDRAWARLDLPGVEVRLIR